MRHQELFTQVMAKGLHAWLDSQSAARKKAVSARNLRFALGMAAAVVAVIFIQFRELDAYGFGQLAILGYFAWWFAQGPIVKFKRNVKVRANEALGAALNLKYRPDGPASCDFELATQLGLLPPKPAISRFRDHWFGTLGVSEGTIQEATLKGYRTDGGKGKLVTVFEGLVIGYQFAKPFTSTTVVIKDWEQKKDLGKWIRDAHGKTLEPVRMVHPEFERGYEVLSNDQVEARYLLHPAFCERLMEISPAFLGTNMRLAFSQGRVVIAIETSNMFESGGVKNEEINASLARTIDQLGSVIDLTMAVNELQLSNDGPIGP